MPSKRLDRPPEPRGEAPAACPCSRGPHLQSFSGSQVDLPRTPTSPPRACCDSAWGCRASEGRLQASCSLCPAGEGVGASPGSPGLGPSPGVPRAELPHQLEPPAALLVAWLSHFSPGAGGVGGATQFLCKAARGFPEPGAALSPAQGRGLPRDGASSGTGASLSCRVRQGLHGIIFFKFSGEKVGLAVTRKFQSLMQSSTARRNDE